MTVRSILRPISTDLQRVQAEVEEQLSELGRVSLPVFRDVTSRAVNHLFSVRGKLLRPALVLLTARVLGAGSHDALVKVAAAVELVHSASLVHDDIMDGAHERRGVPSVNAAFGNKTAVLVGDLLYEQAFAEITALTALGPQAQLALFELFTTTSREMCLGEIYEDEIDTGSPVSLEDYLRVIDYKTASLMSGCCRAAAIVAGAGDEDSRLVFEFGYHLGRTYQLIDDVIDRDSVYFDRDHMLSLARREGETCHSILSRLGHRDGLRSLEGITEAVLRRAPA